MELAYFNFGFVLILIMCTLESQILHCECILSSNDKEMKAKFEVNKSSDLLVDKGKQAPLIPVNLKVKPFDKIASRIRLDEISYHKGICLHLVLYDYMCIKHQINVDLFGVF